MPAKHIRPPSGRFGRLIPLALAIVLLLVACSPTTSDELPVPITAATASPAITPSPTPIIEPPLEFPRRSDGIGMVLPDFTTAPLTDNRPFDLTDAHAVYAYYRQEVGPYPWTNDADFVAAMQAYANQLSETGVSIEQATGEAGETYSLLTLGSQLFLNFDAQGNLIDANPGYWTRDSTGVWVKTNGPVRLTISPDGNAYIAKVDENGKVIAFLNPHGATRDNIDDKWIAVSHGQPAMEWDGAGWVDNPLFNLPDAWQDKIDRIEKLADGRTVAIATSDDPDKESLLRVLQLNKDGQWEKYQPIVIPPMIDESQNDLYYSHGQPELLTDLDSVPRPHFNNNPENPAIPLGHVARTYLDPESEVWIDWYGGAVIGFGGHPEGLALMRVQTRTVNGDFTTVDVETINQFQFGSSIFSLESFGSDIDQRHLADTGISRGTDNDWELRGSQVFKYLNDPENQKQLLHSFIIFGVAGGVPDKPDYSMVMGHPENHDKRMQTRADFYTIIKGGPRPIYKIDLGNRLNNTILEGLILPQSIIDVLMRQ